MMMRAPSPIYNKINSSMATDSETDEDNREDSVLISLVQAYDWAAVLARVTVHPSEAKLIGAEGRTPLHMACEHDAPAVVIQSLLKAYPDASIQIGSSNMTPLHITCSSQDASVNVIRVLLELGNDAQCSFRDVDGDTPLHTACRCGASLDVLEVLIQANPQAVHQRDLEGLTPLLRLWVRYFVILGNDVIEGVRDQADLVGELGDAWKKTDLLLQAAHYGSLDRREPNLTFSLHAAAAVDCPRPVVKIAATVYPEQLLLRDEKGRTPLMLAAQAPIYKVRDLSDDGYSLEDVIHGDNIAGDNNDDTNSDSQPSVIELLLQSCQTDSSSAACVTDDCGRLPLHMALLSGKRWNQGIMTLVEAFPDALGSPIKSTDPSCAGLYPFMMAAAGDSGDLTSAYEILRYSPSVMANIILKNRKKKKIPTVCPEVEIDLEKGNIH